MNLEPITNFWLQTDLCGENQYKSVWFAFLRFAIRC